MTSNCQKLFAALGTHKWVVASRSTPRLLEKYEIVITPRRYKEIVGKSA